MINLNTRSTSTPASEISAASFQDDSGYSVADESKALADILRNSPAAELLGINPESQSEEENEDTSTESPSDEQTAQDPDSDADNDLDETTESDETDEEVNGGDDTSTETTDLPSEEEIDWEYKVPVTVDGKTEYKTLDEIRKGFQTDQHLSQKGRELGELKKQVETERTEKLQELITIGAALNEDWTAQESNYVEQYKKLSADIEKARDEGDSYTARELKEKRETVQEAYWKIRNKREETLKSVTDKIKEDQATSTKKLLDEYNANIKTFIPDYNDKIAESVRKFAIKEGISEVLLNAIYDPSVVKFINDYRKLKTAKESGEVKRKALPPSKSVPLKKGTTQETKKKAADASLRTKVLSGQADATTQQDFLKSISSISRKLQL